MRALGASRTSLAPGGALAGPWVKNELWRRARAVPSLDLRFADNKSLTDSVTGASLVTFTRASSGTYVDSEGVLRTAVTNLLLQSEDFLTTWTVHDGLSRTANQIVSPNGSITADLLAGNGVNIGYVEQPTASSNQFVSGTTYTYSVYLKKANTSTCITLLFGITFNSGGGNPVATWNLDTGIPSFSNGATGSMTPVGNGWYRCVITDTATQTHTQNQQWLRMTSASGDVYAWGAQLEQSSTVGEYIPTTSAINSAPRFDHNPTTGESLGLLVEEARSNLLLRSEEFDNASWTKVRATVSVNTVIAPNGTLTADTGIEDTSASTTHNPLIQDATIVANGTYTASLYVKAKERSRGAIWFSSVDSANWVAGDFNLSTGTISAANAGTGSGAVASIANIGNGWYRVSITGSIGGGLTTGRLVLRLADNTGSIVYTGDGTSGIYIWGAQLEAGAFPTSYIGPTTTAAVTRSADVASITGTAFSGWYRQDEGTMFADFQRESLIPGGTFSNIWSISDSTNNERILSYLTGPSRMDLVVTDNASSQAVLLGPAAIIAGQSVRQGFTYKVDSFVLSQNGSSIVADSGGTLPTTDRLYIGSNSVGTGSWTGTLRRFSYWPARLSNSTLQNITQ